MGGDRGVTPATASARARPRVLLLCSPCMGHLIPFSELARCLVADHGLAATLLFASARSTPSEQYLVVAASVPAEGVDLVALPVPTPADALPADASVRDRATHAVAASVPRVRDIARSLAATAPLVAFVVDMIGAPAHGVAKELGVPFYTFFTSPWMLLSLETYAGFLVMAKDAARADGILVNTFRELEPAVGDGADGVKLPPVHAVGPLVWTRPVSKDRDHHCLSWLDQQPRGSVVYVSFGSGGTLTWQQTAELALGLELSQHRFIWAIKRPDQDTANGAFFGTSHHGGEEDAMEFLPEGFIARTRGLGLVLHSWAPQTAILGHVSVGCFVTHCGWNSTLESVSNGVPMVAWPLYAEQKMNAAMMEAQAKVAIRINVENDRFITKKEIESVLRRVMKGEEADRLRRQIGELKDKAVYALSKGGYSTSALAQFCFG
ncbi:hypothetical protein E2562_003280 [Oryza meyeriana var. granulata]|uniref:Glycosyltransferase n=1 Tax=Oryza meyeriana var. granulata TaxID=110450 RepID=A0A6G1EEN3_9ORYZ|nr:hypothetical protein E2562_003280 [Oryza meyeriana var. granulata]